MNNQPPTKYSEDGGMIHYERIDGQRLFIFTTDTWDNKAYLINAIHAHQKIQYIDYIIYLEEQWIVKVAADFTRTTIVDYPSILQAILHARPTKILVFTKDLYHGDINYLIQLAHCYDIPYEVVTL